MSSLQRPHASHMTHVAVLWANNDDKTVKIQSDLESVLQHLQLCPRLGKLISSQNFRQTY